MSLTVNERRKTSEELQRNLALSGLSAAQVAAALGLNSSDFEGALFLHDGHSPVDVWYLRDYLERAVRAAGAEPEPFTILTEASRARARTWFPLRDAGHAEIPSPS